MNSFDNTFLLLALLAMAAAIDWRSHRIPNWLTGGGFVIAIVWSLLLPSPAQGGVLGALGGAATGLACLLPLYAVRILGAGDVKLMAMCGAFLGFWQTLPALLFVGMAGGVCALAFGLVHGAMGQLLSNARQLLVSLALSVVTGHRAAISPGSTPSLGRMPCAFAIALGVAAYLAVTRLPTA
jgi:prepilin peptidase CpaA